MSSTIIKVPAKTWVQITTTDKQGSVRHTRGNGSVIYLEAITMPTSFNEDTPVMQATTNGDNFPYYQVATGEFIFAYAVSVDIELTVSTAGV